MPLDARSLLRASAASHHAGNGSANGSSSGVAASTQGGLLDRFASYHPKTRMLRCSACDYQPVKHESLWTSHTASKTHRQNVQAIRLREEEAIQSKQRARKEAESDDASSEDARIGSGKRKQQGESETAGVDAELSKRARQADVPATDLDSEWLRFQDEVLKPESLSQGKAPQHTAGAVIEVEPVLRTNAFDEEQDEEADPSAVAQAPEETMAEKQERREREEREEILARLEEEQRLQEEADERASALRARYEAMRRARLERKQGGA